MITSHSSMRIKPTVRFGDALFERHADFSEHQPQRQPSKNYQELLKSGDVDRLLDSISQQTKNAYEPTGRFARSKSSLSTVARLAKREARLRENKLRNTLLNSSPSRSHDLLGDMLILRSHSPIKTVKRKEEEDTALQEAKVKKANAELAQNISPESNKKAFDELGAALDALERRGYFEKDEIDPSIVHGWANRGVHTFDHDVYDTTVKAFGRDEMKEEEAIFEGMAIAPASDANDRAIHTAHVKAEVPFLRRAIALTRKMRGKPDDRSLAKAEYLNRLAEIQHGLSHLEFSRSDAFEQHSQMARQAIQKANDAMEELDSTRRSAYQARLESNLGVKQDHLCSRHKPHRPPIGSPGEALCNTLYSQKNSGMAEPGFSPDFFNMFFTRR